MDKLIINGFSRGVISHWLFVKSYNILFDAGDGVSSRLDDGVSAIKYIALSHSHADHIGGLSALLIVRNRLSGKSPIKVIYHKKAEGIRSIISILPEVVRTNIEVIEVEDADTIPLNNGRYLKVFKTDHSVDSVGFVVCKNVTRLNPRYQNNTAEELIGLKQITNITEAYEHRLFTYTGDTRPLTVDVMDKIKDTDYLVIDCTFLTYTDAETLKVDSHSTVDDVRATIEYVQPKICIVMHLSRQYYFAQCSTLLEGIREKLQTKNTHIQILTTEMV